jgi:hypothetical protein
MTVINIFPTTLLKKWVILNGGLKIKMWGMKKAP